MNPRIIELIIQDGDNEAGLDGIALVEMPAHEAQFEYFSEDKKSEHYVLSEEQSSKALLMFGSFGEPQGQLESEGWYISEVKQLGREEFQILADPNAPSAQDTPTVKFRYKYVGPVDSKNRDFCSEMMSANRVFRIEDINEMSLRSPNEIGPDGYDIFTWRGSYNCRHKWVQLVYKQDSRIVNKASVRKGLIDEDGMPGPDTRTTATIEAGNTPPRTGFSKEKMDINVSSLQPYVDQVTDEVEEEPILAAMEGNLNVLGYPTRYFHLCPLAIELFQHFSQMPSDSETQGMIRSAAQIADNVFRIEDEVIKRGSGTRDELLQAIILVEDFRDLIREIDEETGMVHNVLFMEGHLEKIAEYVKDSFAGEKISIDYDETLTTERGMELAKNLIKDGVILYIISARQDKEPMLKRAQELGIPTDRIFATGSNKAKIEKIKELGIIKHHDNNDDVIKELGSIGVKFVLEEACWEGYEPIGTKILDGREVPNCVPINEEMSADGNYTVGEFASFDDYPELIRKNAKAAIDWIDKTGNPRGCMTQVGKVRAQQLAQGKPISIETVKRMKAYITRHQKDLETSKSYDDGCGKLAMDAWGGVEALPWVERTIAKYEEMKSQEFSFQVFNNDQRLVVGPAMIPDKMIIRRNEITGEIYYVYFTSETIKKLQQKFMQEKLLDKTNIEHGRKFLNGVDVVESWIVEDREKDKQQVFGMDYPKGTWMITMKVNDDSTWEKVKDGKLKGFSVQGYFLEKAKFSHESQEVINEIKQILKEIK